LNTSTEIPLGLFIADWSNYSTENRWAERTVACKSEHTRHNALYKTRHGESVNEPSVTVISTSTNDLLLSEVVTD